MFYSAIPLLSFSTPGQGNENLSLNLKNVIFEVLMIDRHLNNKNGFYDWKQSLIFHFSTKQIRQYLQAVKSEFFSF